MSQRALAKRQDALVREQVRHAVAPFSPYWKARFNQLGTTPASIDGVAKLATVPAVVTPPGWPR